MEERKRGGERGRARKKRLTVRERGLCNPLTVFVSGVGRVCVDCVERDRASWNPLPLLRRVCGVGCFGGGGYECEKKIGVGEGKPVESWRVIFVR